MLKIKQNTFPCSYNSWAFLVAGNVFALTPKGYPDNHETA